MEVNFAEFCFDGTKDLEIYRRVGGIEIALGKREQLGKTTTIRENEDTTKRQKTRKDKKIRKP